MSLRPDEVKTVHEALSRDMVRPKSDGYRCRQYRQEVVVGPDLKIDLGRALVGWDGRWRLVGDNGCDCEGSEEGEANGSRGEEGFPATQRPMPQCTD